MAYPFDDYMRGQAFYNAMPQGPGLPGVDMAALANEPFQPPALRGPGLPQHVPIDLVPTVPNSPYGLYVEEKPNASGVQTSPWGGVLDSLATAFANTDFNTPNNFGGGLLKGFAQGFSAVRGKKMTEREKQRESEVEHARKRNEANLKATLDQQQALRTRAEDLRKRRLDRQDYQFRQTVDALLKPNSDGTFTLTDAEAKIMGAGYTPGQVVPREIKSEAMLRTRPKEQKLWQNEVEVSPQAEAIIKSVSDGKIAPSFFTQMSRSGTLRDQVMVGLAQQGVDLNGLENDYQSERAFLRTQNGPKFMTIRSNGQALLHTLDRAEAAFNDLRKMVPSLSVSGLNKAQLALLKTRNDKVGEAARRLDVIVNDVVPEIGSMVMGGNANTDHSLELAAHNLSADWNEVQFLDAIKQARLTTRTRLNAMSSLQPYELENRSSPALPTFHAALTAQRITTQGQFDTFLTSKDKSGRTGRQRLFDQGLTDKDLDDLKLKFAAR